MIVGVGIDIIEVARIEKAVERWGNLFLEHVFTPQEIAWAQKFKFPYQHYAGRFPAKEAIFKAINDPTATWQEFTILNDEAGRPVCTCTKKNFQNKILLTISHIKDYAVAQAIVTS